MFKRLMATVSTATLGVAVMAQAALAQRPPSGSQGPPQMSFERAWAWLMARPGVLIAIAIIVAALVYMFVTRKKTTT